MWRARSGGNRAGGPASSPGVEVDLTSRTYQQAIAIHREVGERRFEAVHSRDFSLLLLAHGKASQARKIWCQAAAILRQIHDTEALQSSIASMRDACSKAGVRPFDE